LAFDTGHTFRPFPRKIGVGLGVTQTHRPPIFRAGGRRPVSRRLYVCRSERRMTLAMDRTLQTKSRFDAEFSTNSFIFRTLRRKCGQYQPASCSSVYQNHLQVVNRISAHSMSVWLTLPVIDRASPDQPSKRDRGVPGFPRRRAVFMLRFMSREPPLFRGNPRN